MFSSSCSIENRERGEERDLRRSWPIGFFSTLYLYGVDSSLSFIIEFIQVLLLVLLSSLFN
jgi:hypothetical protein